MIKEKRKLKIKATCKMIATVWIDRRSGIETIDFIEDFDDVEILGDEQIIED